MCVLVEYRTRMQHDVQMQTMASNGVVVAVQRTTQQQGEMREEKKFKRERKKSMELRLLSATLLIFFSSIETNDQHFNVYIIPFCWPHLPSIPIGHNRWPMGSEVRQFLIQHRMAGKLRLLGSPSQTGRLGTEAEIPRGGI